jgi:hypothetical protein
VRSFAKRPERSFAMTATQGGPLVVPAFVGFPAIASHPWLYPALECVHIVGVALLLGNLLLLELRVWGFGRALDTQALAGLALPVSAAGFGLLALSGMTMFAAAPAELLANRMFVIKMGLVMLAGLNAAAFHARGGLHRRDRIARVQTLLSLELWLAVIICGRWIAYA